MNSFRKLFLTSTQLMELLLLFIVLSSIAIYSSQCSPVPIDGEDPGEECNFTGISAIASPSNLDILSGSSGEVTMRVEVTSPNCVNMGNNFKVELFDSNPPGITITGCGFQAMSQNTGNCQFTVHVPNGASSGTYTIQLKTTISLRSVDDETRMSTIHVNVASSADFSIDIVNSFGIFQGFTTIVPVNVVRTGGHDIDINLSLVGMPINTTHSFEPNPVTVNDPSSQLTIYAEYDAIPADHLGRQVKGTDLNNLERHDSFNLYVGEPFTIAFDQDSVTIAQGNSGTVDVYAGFIGIYQGTVSLSAEGDVIGQGSNSVEPSFNPNTLVVGSSTSHLTLTVGDSVPQGIYPITIYGFDDNLTKSGLLHLTVEKQK